MGPMVMGTVPDFDTHVQTVPVAVVSQYTSQVSCLGNSFCHTTLAS